MGAWGYGVFDNDSACDWISTFVNNKALSKLVKQKDPDPNDLRAAAAVVIQLHKISSDHIWFDQEVLDKLVASLQCVLDEKEWFDTWRDPRDANDIKREMRRYIRQLKELGGYGA